MNLSDKWYLLTEHHAITMLFWFDMILSYDMMIRD